MFARKWLPVHLLSGLVLCGAGGELAAAGQQPAATRVRELEWAQLVPDSERGNYIPGPPPPNHGYLDGFGSKGFGQFGRSRQEEPDCTGLALRFDPSCENAGQLNMSSAVNESLDGSVVRLKGYIVPLEVSAAGKVTEFFLAAYAGACIHVPPPPPNQMVYVKAASGNAPTSLYDAYVVTGVLHTHGKVVGLGGSAYSMEVRSVERLR